MSDAPTPDVVLLLETAETWLRLVPEPSSYGQRACYPISAGLVQGLVDAVGARCAVIARISDGWDYVRPWNTAGRQGEWWQVRLDVKAEPMTNTEQRVVYGAVVRPGEAL